MFFLAGLGTEFVLCFLSVATKVAYKAAAPMASVFYIILLLFARYGDFKNIVKLGLNLNYL
jgi:hypothetical protein